MCFCALERNEKFCSLYTPGIKGNITHSCFKFKSKCLQRMHKDYCFVKKKNVFVTLAPGTAAVQTRLHPSVPEQSARGGAEGAGEEAALGFRGPAEERLHYPVYLCEW